jgi:hypothetical protein
MCAIEDILFEAHREGLREQVLITLDTIQQMHSHMEMRDKVELAYKRVKNNNDEKNIYNMSFANNIY